MAETAAIALRPGMVEGGGMLVLTARGVVAVIRLAFPCFCAVGIELRTQGPPLAGIREESENPRLRGGAEFGVRGDNESVDSEGEEESYGFLLIGRGRVASEIAIEPSLGFWPTTDRRFFVAAPYSDAESVDVPVGGSSDGPTLLLILS